jgi:diguanylate cyclase (GGDEF)-like protein
MNKTFRIFLLGILLISIIFSISYIYINQRVDALKIKKYIATSKEMKNELNLMIDKKSEAVLLVSLTLSKNSVVTDFLDNDNHKKLELDRLSSLLGKYTSLTEVWFQIIDTHGVSVYRSWREKKGDNLSNIRLDVAKMLTIPKIMSTMSIGRFDLTFKCMVPIYGKHGRFIGIVETIGRFNSLLANLENRGLKSIILADKRYKRQLSHAMSNVFINDYYVVNPKNNNDLIQIVKQHSVNYFLNIDGFDIDKTNNNLYTVVKLYNIEKEPMAYFILTKPLNEIDMTSIYAARDDLIKTFFVIFLFVLVFLYIIYSINYKNFIQKQNELLEGTVEEKIEELQKQSKKLEYLAHHDSLTTLPNKNLFLDRFKQSIKYAKREHQSLAVLFLDLDRFKDVNDTYGHDIGDELLKKISIRLRSCIRDEDTLARIGGDEYTILLPNTNQVSVVKVVEKIFKEMNKPFLILDVDIHTTFSVGISLYKQDGETPDILLRNADTAMYKAKDAGKNSYQFYNEQMTELVQKRIQLDNDIRNGLTYEEFEPYYQPKVDARTSTVVGLEALIRWNHPTKGTLYPDEFIPFAQEVGLITQIDKYMLEHCIKQLVQWKESGVKTGKLSINISTKKLESENFRTELYRLVEKSGVDTDLLELEILETQIMQDPEKSIDILKSIRNLGISISIDDFGTGYSSLSYLKRLPINKLKIDRSFIVDVPEDEDDVAIVRTIIALADNLGLETIAEGVETKKQIDFLTKEGCFVIQGYYYSKPLSREDCEAFLRKHT